MKVGHFAKVAGMDCEFNGSTQHLVLMQKTDRLFEERQATSTFGGSRDPKPLEARRIRELGGIERAGSVYHGLASHAASRPQQRWDQRLCCIDRLNPQPTAVTRLSAAVAHGPVRGLVRALDARVATRLDCHLCCTARNGARKCSSTATCSDSGCFSCIIFLTTSSLLFGV